ncbi:MAG: hypothetical protein AB1416_09240 [Actinomycetota bacterium]
MVRTLSDLGFVEAPVGLDEVAHRFRRQAVTVDVLAPEGVGRRTDLRTVGRATTVEIPGGTFALRRSAGVEVTVAGRRGVVHRPDVLGALVVKSRAVVADARRGPERHLRDLAFLYTLVQDPIALRDELSSANRRRLRAVREVADADPACWSSLGDAELIFRARAALDLMGSP